MAKTKGETPNPLSDKTDLLRGVISTLEYQVEQIITPNLANRIEKIYIAGCGDSFYAGLAARLFFDKYTGVQTEPFESLEFSRYVVDFIPKNSLLFAVSNSGQVSRTIEAAILARQRKAYVIAATGFEDKPLAKEADAILLGNLPEVKEAIEALMNAVSRGNLSQGELIETMSDPDFPDRMAKIVGVGGGLFNILLIGMGAFLVSLLTLFIAGFRIAKLRGRLTTAQADSLKQEMIAFIGILEDTAAHNLQKALELANSLKHLDTFLILGAGPNYGTAQFAAAKLFEQPNLMGVPQELEEWAHEQFFVIRPGMVIFVLVPPGNSRDRAIEQIKGARSIGATIIAICDSEDREVMDLADESMAIYGRMPEEFSPLTYIVPGLLFASVLFFTRGRPPMKAPYDLQHVMKVSFNQIQRSALKRS